MRLLCVYNLFSDSGWAPYIYSMSFSHSFRVIASSSMTIVLLVNEDQIVRVVSLIED